MTPKEELAELLRERTKALAALDAVVARYEALVAEPRHEPTRMDEDTKAYRYWCDSAEHTPSPMWNMGLCWMAALAWERAEVLVLINNAAYARNDPTSEHMMIDKPNFVKLARRVGLAEP